MLSSSSMGRLDVWKLRLGPKLTPADVDMIKSRIESELLASAGTRIGREILFAHLPVTGYFRYKDEFQILPVPNHAPQPPFSWADYPFLLEFRFPISPSFEIRHLRGDARARQLYLILVGLLWGNYQADRLP